MGKERRINSVDQEKNGAENSKCGRLGIAPANIMAKIMIFSFIIT
jgi:hypothetical protein